MHQATVSDWDTNGMALRSGMGTLTAFRGQAWSGGTRGVGPCVSHSIGKLPDCLTQHTLVWYTISSKMLERCVNQVCSRILQHCRRNEAKEKPTLFSSLPSQPQNSSFVSELDPSGKVLSHSRAPAEAPATIFPTRRHQPYVMIGPKAHDNPDHWGFRA